MSWIPVALTLVLTVLLVALAAEPRTPSPNLIAITGGTVIDCTGRPPIPDGVVIIEGDRIKTVGRRGEVRVPQAARSFDASGKFVLPGLIDMHVHYREWHGELFLAGGVTTIKDLGNPVEWISELALMQKQGKLRAPRIFYVGNNIDSPPPEPDHAIGVASAYDVEKAVRILNRFGVVAIKIRQKISPELLATVTRTAHTMGLPVSGHLGGMSATDAAIAGIDGLEHATGVALAASESPDKVKTDAKGIRAYFQDLQGFTLMTSEKEARLIRLLVERKVKLIPTISTRRRAITEGDTRWASENSRFAHDPALVYVPQQVRKEWSEAAIDKKIRESFSKEEMAIMREGYRRLELFVKNFHVAGGTVIAGTDTLNDIGGLTLQRELGCMVEAGLTPIDALLAATRDAARFLGHDELGTIEPGKIADLVITTANPTDDISNISKVYRVFQEGRELDTQFHADYALPRARPSLVRPLAIELMLGTEK